MPNARRREVEAEEQSGRADSGEGSNMQACEAGGLSEGVGSGFRTRQSEEGWQGLGGQGV